MAVRAKQKIIDIDIINRESVKEKNFNLWIKLSFAELIIASGKLFLLRRR